MSEFKPKRLITHKELEKAVEIRRDGVSEQIPLHRVVIYVYYLKGGRPLDTGNTAYAILNREGYLSRVNPNRKIVWKVNVGEWIERTLYKVLSDERYKGWLTLKPSDISRKEWSEALWTGYLQGSYAPTLKLTQKLRDEVKKGLYRQINHNGTIALHEEEEQLKNGLDDEKERKLLEDTIKDILMDIEGNIYSRLNLDSVESHHALDFNIFIDALTLEELRDVEQGARDYINNPGM